MTFDCPKGCKAQGGKPVAQTIKGWKHHMTRAHKGYSEEQLSVILGTAPTDSATGKEQFLSESDVIGGPTPEKPVTPEVLPPEKTVSLKTEQVGKKFSGKLNKMKSAIAKKFPDMLSSAIKDKGPEWQLSESDADFFAESVENCFEVLDIDFQITPISTVLTNPLWVLLLPMLALVMIFLPKMVANAKIPGTEEPTSDESQEMVGQTVGAN